MTVEKIHDGNLLDDPVLAAGTLPGFYVESIAVAERGAWPLPLPDHYAADAEHLALYARMAATAKALRNIWTSMCMRERGVMFRTPLPLRGRVGRTGEVTLSANLPPPGRFAPTSPPGEG